ncbi:MAG: cyclic nucleotide-binding domain-containing protein [Desulfatiglans sp.]|jgi:CRP-like cAMP-binding protein|nr:cyclic nucleotide-binding domain-containing protein [Thermodesulfobacteriota bacterium]MEE4353403.1 cyclic nucleotide-binding domain-containing protein [Desulfatiglans sp.]
MTIEQFIYGYIAKEETYQDGDIILEEGSSGDWVFVILRGQVKVKKRTPKGMITLDTLKEGEIFGELVLLQTGRKARTASVVADGPLQVGILDNEQLFKDYDAIPQQLRSLLRSLAKRLVNTTNKAVSMVLEHSK